MQKNNSMYFNIQIYARQLRDSQTTIPYQTRDIEIRT